MSSSFPAPPQAKEKAWERGCRYLYRLESREGETKELQRSTEELKFCFVTLA